MFLDSFDAVGNAAKAKANLLKKNPLGYFVASMLAGIFIAMGSFASNTAGAPFAAAGDPAQKLIQGLVFCSALNMVILAGSELFTGNNMIMAAGALGKKVSWGEVVKVWIVCYLGNLVGSILSAFIFQASGIPTGAVADVFVSAAETKMNLGPVELVFRAIFCNILVCTATWCSIKLKSDSGKILMIFWCIFTFMMAGFEHSVANMSSLMIGVLNAGDAAVSLGGYVYNLFFVTIGNIIGGALCIGLPYYLISKEK